MQNKNLNPSGCVALNQAGLQQVLPYRRKSFITGGVLEITGRFLVAASYTTSSFSGKILFMLLGKTNFVSRCNDSQGKEQNPTLSKARNFEGHKHILDVRRSPGCLY